MPALPYTPDPEANAFLGDHPFALVVGLVLQQQIPVERAFAAPFELARRLGGVLDPDTLAHVDPDRLAETFRAKPALHRFPASMARRVQHVARFLVERYDGRTEALWEGIADAAELVRRVEELPGFGEYKARILLGILARWYGVRPSGHEALVPDWPSIVDVERIEDLEVLKARKREWKERRR